MDSDLPLLARLLDAHGCISILASGYVRVAFRSKDEEFVRGLRERLKMGAIYVSRYSSTATPTFRLWVTKNAQVKALLNLVRPYVTVARPRVDEALRVVTAKCAGEQMQKEKGEEILRLAAAGWKQWEIPERLGMKRSATSEFISKARKRGR